MHHLRYWVRGSGCRYCRREGRSDAQVATEGRSDLCDCYAGESSDRTWYDNPNEDSATPPMDGWTLQVDVSRFNSGCGRCGGRGCGVAEAVEQARWTDTPGRLLPDHMWKSREVCWDPTLRDFRCRRPGEALVSVGWDAEAMCPTDMLVVPSLTWVSLPQCQRHAQMRWDSEEMKRLGRGRELRRLRLRQRQERERRLGLRVLGFLREVANFYGLNCHFSSYYWPSFDNYQPKK
jgi:hypothetical protein